MKVGIARDGRLYLGSMGCVETSLSPLGGFLGGNNEQSGDSVALFADNIRVHAQ